MRDAEIIKRETAIFYNLTRKEIEGPSRRARITYPRMIAMTLSRHYTRDSLPKIGRIYGGKDHTTVLHSMRRTTARVIDVPELAAEISTICYRIELEIAALQQRQAQLVGVPLVTARPPIALLPPPPKISMPPRPQLTKPARDTRWTTFTNRAPVPA